MVGESGTQGNSLSRSVQETCISLLTRNMHVYDMLSFASFSCTGFLHQTAHSSIPCRLCSKVAL